MLVLVAVSILWIPMIQASQGSQLFVYIQNITSYLAPPVCAVYLMAFFIPRTTEQVLRSDTVLKIVFVLSIKTASIIRVLKNQLRALEL